jgi:hypothetical protein
MYGSFRNDVGVETVAEIDRVDVVAAAKLACVLEDGSLESHAAQSSPCAPPSVACTHHSKSLYIIVKNTCRNRLTAFINTASRYNHASPVIVRAFCVCKQVMDVRKSFAITWQCSQEVLQRDQEATLRALWTRVRSCVCRPSSGLDAES